MTKARADHLLKIAKKGKEEGCQPESAGFGAENVKNARQFR